MKKRFSVNFFYATSILFVLLCLGCSSNKEKEVEDIHTRIEYYEDSIRQWGGGQGFPEDRDSFANRYISVLLQAYQDDPQHAKTPEYLDRLHMWYVTKNETENAIKWATQVVENYPQYPNRKMLIESIATMYDSDSVLRDSARVRHYYTQLLTEFPSIDPADKSAIQERLKYNHLSLEEYIQTEVSSQE